MIGSQSRDKVVLKGEQICLEGCVEASQIRPSARIYPFGWGSSTTTDVAVCAFPEIVSSEALGIELCPCQQEKRSSHGNRWMDKRRKA